MVQENRCKHEINKMTQVLKETEVMIPLIKDKLSEAVFDLEEFIDENKNDLEKLSLETYAKAVEQIGLSKSFLESIQEETLPHEIKEEDPK